MIANWRLVFAETANDLTIDAFDASIQQLTRLIGKPGVLRATIAIPNETVGGRLRRIIGGEGRLSVYAYRDSQLWWGGFLDQTRVEADENETVLIISGTTYEAYPSRREARTTNKLTSMDQLQIAKWIWDDMQNGGVGSDILVETNEVGTCGVSQTIEWKRSDVKTWENILTEVSATDQGFEWVIDTWDDGSRRRRALRCGYPIIGRNSSDTVLSRPGAILTYAIDGDMLDGATSFQARGKAPDAVGKPGKKASSTPSVAADPVMSDEYHADALHKAGYTRIDATVDRSRAPKDNVAENTKAVLNKWAEAARALRSGPLVLPEITCRIDGLNSGLLGGRVLIRIRDAAYPAGPQGEPGYQGYARVIGIEVDPGEQGFDDEVKLIFEDPHSDQNLAEEVL